MKDIELQTTPLQCISQKVFDALFERGHRLSVKDYEAIKNTVAECMPFLTNEFMDNDV